MAKLAEIQLSQPKTKSNVSLEEAIAKRRSIRSFRGNELSELQLSQLLWAAQGITTQKGDFSLRTAPSAGALYPIEIYAVTGKGVYHYVPEGHKIEVWKEADLRKNLSEAAMGQESVSQAAASFVICAVFSRITSKYGDRGVNYCYIEAGHIAQNLHLQAVSLGLGSVPVGAYSDIKVKEILNLPQDHEPVYIIPVGYPK